MIATNYNRTVYGVGYYGDMDNFEYTNSELSIWTNMISRCYNLNNENYQYYGARGITVCYRWHCFRFFVEDYRKLPGYDDMINHPEIKYNLDKDILQQGIPTNMKVYSPETCMLVPRHINCRQVIIDHKEGTKNQYYGVFKLDTVDRDSYQCRIMVNTKDCYLGTYYDEEAAANMYNHIASACGITQTLNNVKKYMTISECLQCKGDKEITLPDGINIPEIEEYNIRCRAKLGIGYNPKTGSYTSKVWKDHKCTWIGNFDDPIAAANARNFYLNFYQYPGKITDVPFMSAEEWLQHKLYGTRIPKPKQLYNIVEQDDDERKARCKSIYGIDI